MKREPNRRKNKIDSSFEHLKREENQKHKNKI